MGVSITQQIRELEDMTVPELKEKYREVFGEETRAHHKRHLFRKIAWRIQANAEGGLSERALARAREIANESDIRVRPPKGFLDGGATAAPTVSRRLRDARLPVAGTVLERDYKGHTVRVKVLKEGFEYDGQVYRSLSAIAREVTGTNWNGLLFFGLRQKGGN